MTLVERFLKYVSFDTQSSEETEITPSTPGQMVFARYLKEELEGDYRIMTRKNGREAYDTILADTPDLVISDIMMPEMDGIQTMVKIRENSNVPVIFLTAKSEDNDKVLGLMVGADDYITKPFSLSVLLLKIEAHFRRRQEKTEAGKMISGDIVFITGEMKVLIKSREISLTKTELKMLTFFLQNPKQILSKTQILENVFDLEGDFVDENTIAVNIRRLREKIEDNPAAPVYIKNIRGLGYIWNQEVRQ